ncbi:hepatocyte growth factor activator [Megalops cyprinoides]|uniref:hepatocyte growth factor activator n=1 Tax=Megalops cyprinoides TaxID=118141 RepID=UPI00186534F0|nr:hepatocyte growth factor activator [Megalops cyprinoides]
MKMSLAIFLLLPCVFSARTRMVPPGYEVLNSRTAESETHLKVLTVNGKECKFPFRYGGIVYHRCIRNRSSKPWCATTYNFDRDLLWDYCLPETTDTRVSLFSENNVTDLCADKPCHNGGLCTNIPHSRSFECTCREGFTGKLCTQEQCYEEVHMKYYDIGESWGRIHRRNVEQCTCDNGEILCERVRYTACILNPCQNDGTCRLIISTGEAVCACRPGFAGQHCSITPEAECYENNGTEYRGTANVTISGARCLPWNSDLLNDELHVDNVENAALLGLGEHAFCRNPDDDEMPWCYIMKETEISWEYCDISPCRVALTLSRRVMSSDGPPPSEPEKPSRAPVCGKRHSKRMPRARILGGHSALPGLHPWVAALYIGESFCAGSLIASCWVVSAAHCFAGSPLVSSVRVVLGQHHFNDTGPNAKSYRIEKYIFPDQFSVYNPTLHDIVLIKLKKENGRCAKRSQFVQPICLPGKDITFPDYHCCQITGWGHMYEKANAYAKHLMEATVHIIPIEQCTRPDVYGQEVTANMLCAGSHRCIDACQGDSGGPLDCVKNGVHFLYGIISWGDGCGRNKKPGVYTRVSNYVDWINRIIKPKS